MRIKTIIISVCNSCIKTWYPIQKQKVLFYVFVIIHFLVRIGIGKKYLSKNVKKYFKIVNRKFQNEVYLFFYITNFVDNQYLCEQRQNMVVYKN